MMNEKTEKMIIGFKKELALSNCGFDHYPESMVRSQWQSRSRNNFYLLYRWVVAAFAIGVVIYSMINNYKIHDDKPELTTMAKIGHFFIYLTRWGLLMNMTVSVFGAILVTIWYFHTEYQEKIMENQEMPISFKIYWAMHNIALDISFVVTIVYWYDFHKKERTEDDIFHNVLTHISNSVIMFIDILIVAHPIKIYHAIQTVCFGICYGIFTYIYFLCDGENEKGYQWIYEELNWNDPGRAVLIMVLSLSLAVCVHIFLFGVCKLRIYIQRRYFTTSIQRETQLKWDATKLSILTDPSQSPAFPSANNPV